MPQSHNIPGPGQCFLWRRIFFSFTSVYDFYDKICFYIDSVNPLNMSVYGAVIDHKSSSMFWLGAWSIIALLVENNSWHPYQFPVWSVGNLAIFQKYSQRMHYSSPASMKYGVSVVRFDLNIVSHLPCCPEVHNIVHIVISIMSQLYCMKSYSLSYVMACDRLKQRITTVNWE